MFKVYDPQNGFRLVGKARTIAEAFAIAKRYAKATRREHWVDNPHGILAGVATATGQAVHA